VEHVLEGWDDRHEPHDVDHDTSICRVRLFCRRFVPFLKCKFYSSIVTTYERCVILCAQRLRMMR
jgi:hypothetical protein